MTIGVPIVIDLPRLYQPCTNSVPKQSKDSQNSKNHRWCTNRHMSTQRPPNTQSRYIPTVSMDCCLFTD